MDTNKKWVIACNKEDSVNNQRESANVKSLWANIQISSKSIQKAGRALPCLARSGAKQPEKTHSTTVIIKSQITLMYLYCRITIP